MKITKNKKSGFTVAIVAEIDFADVDKYIDENYESLVKDVKADGFRKGKIPKNIFIKKFDENYLYQQAVYPLLNKSYQEILKQEKLQVVSAPYEVDIKESKKGEPLQFSFKVDTVPEVKLKKYKSLKVTKEEVVVEDQEVEAILENLQKNYLNLEETQEAVSDGFIVEHELVAEDNEGNKPVAFNKSTFITKLGSKFLGEEFENNLLAMKKDEEKEFSVKIAEDHQNKEIAGKDLKVKVKINKIHKEVLPELTDEFIKKVSGQETLVAFKEERKKQLLERKEHQAEDKFINDLMEQLIQENKFDIPQSMVDSEVANMINSFAMDLYQRYKTKLDDYLKMINKTQDDLKNDYRENAQKRVKINLLLEEIVKAEEFVITEEEVEKSLDLPEQYKDNEEIKNYYREMMKAQLARERAIAMIKDTAKK